MNHHNNTEASIGLSAWFATVGLFFALTTVSVYAAWPAPRLLSPENGATNVSLRPTFRWHAVDEARFYSIQVSKSSSFGADIVINDGSETTTFVTDRESSLSPGTKYYWRVSVGELDAPWSEVWSFTTVAAPAPDRESPSDPESASEFETPMQFQPEQ